VTQFHVCPAPPPLSGEGQETGVIKEDGNREGKELKRWEGKEQERERKKNGE